MTDEQKQKRREGNKRYKENMSDEQKQKKREYDKQYGDNMTDEQKQKLRYQKKNYAAKKLNNKIIDDNNNDNDNDFYCISIIIKLKNIVPIKDIDSILKINKKVCSQAYLEGCNFINDNDNKND